MALTAIFAGDGSLLIECADLFVARGGRVRAILTTDMRVGQWAKAQGHIQAVSPADPVLVDSAADYVLSVANLKILPPSLLAQAKTMAINFHDGPLPGYAGLNVTSWAILAAETSHAVTWHEMTGKVDSGQILAERVFEIAPDETAFSLNTKCYSAAVDAFGDVLDAMFTGQLLGRMQQGERHWFGKDRRPGNFGVLDFSQSAAQLSALVRALDFGPYPNTLTAAKLWTGFRLLVVRKLETEVRPTLIPGQVLEIGDGKLIVSARDFAVVLSGIETLDGRKVARDDFGLKTGAVLAAIDQAPVSYSAKADDHWRAELAGMRPAAVPFSKAVAGDATAACSIGIAMPGGLTPDEIAAGFAAWIGLLSNEKELALGLPLPVAGQTPFVRAEFPCAFVLDATISVRQLSETIPNARHEAKKIGRMSGDLLACLPQGSIRDQAAGVLATAIDVDRWDRDDGAILAGRNLVLAISDGAARLIGRSGLYSGENLAQAATSLGGFFAGLSGDPARPIAEMAITDLPDLCGPLSGIDHAGRIETAFRDRARATPGQVAMVAGATTLTYGELDAKSDALAGVLVAKGAKQGSVVGICLPRSVELIVAMLAVLKAGAAYLPLDPDYPVDRVRFMLDDSAAALIIANAEQVKRFALDQTKIIAANSTAEPCRDFSGDAAGLAYLIYTSGSTGTPKGVMVSHRNVVNFMAGMDALVPHAEGDRLLAVTSVSFDISVLEIFWTLTRGMTMVLQTEGSDASDKPSFSLFYFASEAAGTGHHAYRLLLEGAKFADENGFEAIWTPERHFHAFGGLYPNPAVSSAMVAGITRNVKIRAGSIVLPLHHPVRAAEDWALVDNLSGGRAGMAIASGWQPNDFILQPQNFDSRKDVMLQSIDTIRALWRGETVEFPNHKGDAVKTTTLPRPVNGTIPLWITAAGNPETFAAAARKGCGVLTHLLGQTFDEVAEKIRAYRVAWAEAGHPGTGTVTLMLHTFVGDDEDSVRETVRLPMRSYLKSAVDLIKRASWSFPTFVQKADASGTTPQQVFEKEALTEAETDALLDHAFNRYYRESGLFGTPESCVEIVRKVAAIGVDEIACLIDFGVDTDLALAHLHHIKTLMDNVKGAASISRKASVAEHIVENGITHLQCTPSAASMLLADAPGRSALRRLQALLVGGEAFPPDLAKGLREQVPGVLLNMYGPTETTVWSAVARLDVVAEKVPLGAPIANTRLSVRNSFGQPLPEGIAGELWIGGAGVVPGYWQRPELTADRFVQRDGQTFYRTGDLVRREGDFLEFLGRMDNQVKINGHRIELGEIEVKLAALAGVRQSIVVAQTDAAGDRRLLGYCAGDTRSKPDPAALKAALAAGLPDFMVPSQIVVVDHFPLTPNGKIDRKALAAPPLHKTGDSDEALGGTEEAIAEIWREALGLAQVGVTDNFFDLGGHSLLVVQVQRRLKQKFGKEIPIVDMFRYSTIQALAERVDGVAANENAAAKRGQERALARRSRMARRAGS